MDGGRQKQFGQKQDIVFKQEYNQNFTGDDSNSLTGGGSDVTLSVLYGLKFLPFNNNKYAQQNQF